MSESINHNYTLEMEVLSPLHIGAGSEKDWVKGLDFIQDREEIFKINEKKLHDYFSVDELSEILIRRNQRKIINNVSDLSKISTIIFDFPFEASDEIKTHIKTGLKNKPFVPGSSLKGAIRSILFNYLKPYNENKENKIFGSSVEGDDLMRFIKISDAHFEDTQLIQTKIHNLSEDNFGNFVSGWKHARRGNTTEKFKKEGFQTTYEIIPPLEKAIFSLSLSEKQFNQISFHKIKEKKAQLMVNNDISNLFKIINIYADKYINREIDYLNKYKEAEHTEKIISYFEYLKEQIPENNIGCLLRMSAGSGFHSITGDWQFNSHSIDEIDIFRGRSRGKYQHKKSAKSRKIAFGEYEEGIEFMPMGFILLTLKDN